MGVKRGFSKKGQEGISITTLLLLVLGIVVVVVVILGVTGGLNFIFEKFKLLPGQSLQTVVAACDASAELKLSVDYCSFKEVKIDSSKEFINCEDSRVQQAMKQTKLNNACETITAESKCQSIVADAISGVTDAAARKTKCEGVTSKVNGALCNRIVNCNDAQLLTSLTLPTCQQLGGTPKAACAANEDSISSATYQKLSNNQLCCKLRA